MRTLYVYKGAYPREKKRLFHSYTDTSFKDNQLLAYEKGRNGQLEIIFWKESFEIYYRPYRKMYGYLIHTCEELKKAFNLIDTIYREKYLF